MIEKKCSNTHNFKTLHFSSDLGKKSTLHVSEQCFSNFGVSLIFPHNSVYAKLFNEAILRFAASGLDLKIANDMAWDLQRTESQRLLDSKASQSFGMGNMEERKLNLADTEGMFLLMAIGYVLAGSVLFSEIVGGCAKSCRAFMRRSSISDSNSRRGSTFSASQIQSDESRSFVDKLKHNIRRRWRPKSQHHVSDVRSETGESSGPNNSEESNCLPEKVDEPALKGSMSFCSLKRILLMRKQRKEEENAVKRTIDDVATENDAKAQQTDHSENKLEHRIRVDEGAISGENSVVTKHTEQTNEIGDGDSSSIYLDTNAIKEKTEAEVNQFSVDSDRENNPSKEFGELV